MKSEQPVENVSLYTLDNGLRVVIDERTAKYHNLAYAGVYVHSGSDDDGNKRGIAHFVEHMVCDGGGKNHSRLQYLRVLENEVTGDFSAVTTSDDTHYTLKGFLAADLPKAVGALTDIVGQTVIRPSGLKRQKKTVCNEIAETTEAIDVGRDLLKIMWGNHPATYGGLGTREDVMRLRMEDVEEFHTNHYTPDNAIVSVVGACDHTQIIDLANNAFQQRTYVRSARQPTPVFQSGHQNYHTNAERPSMVMRFESLTQRASLREDAACEMLKGIMKSQTGGMFKNLRTKNGYVYAYNCVEKASEDVGFFEINFSTEEDAFSQALAVVGKELASLKKYRGNDLRALRKSADISRQQALFDQDQYGHKNAARLMVHDTIWQPEHVLAARKSIQRSDIQEMACRLFSQNVAMATVFPDGGSPDMDTIFAFHQSLGV